MYVIFPCFIKKNISASVIVLLEMKVTNILIVNNCACCIVKRDNIKKVYQRINKHVSATVTIRFCTKNVKFNFVLFYKN